MKRSLAALFLAAVPLAIASPSHAATCALDEAPGATLLLPYFEVDTIHANGRTTLFSINNAGPLATLAHVVLWTDMAVPTLTFDVYLTGYDVETINLRDVFTGTLPQTADAGDDPTDRISPKGRLSQDISFPGCAGALPPPQLSDSARDALRRAHTGLGSAGDPTVCSGQALGDGIARGFVTVDAARSCSILRPIDAGYFGPSGVATDANVLWGDFFYVTPGAQETAQGQNLVRLESDPQGFAGKPTFYSDYVSGNGSDGREPLPTTWAVRYLDGGSFNGGTALLSWRDIRQVGTTFQCGHYPTWYPLQQRYFVVFDEQENPAVPITCPVGECPPQAPLLAGAAAANSVVVGGPVLPVPFNFGWLFLDLNSPTTTTQPAPSATPSWVGTIVSARGLYSAGLAGTPLDEPCAPNATGAIDPGFRP